VAGHGMRSKRSEGRRSRGGARCRRTGARADGMAPRPGEKESRASFILPPGKQRGYALVVEDDAATREHYCELLRARGFATLGVDRGVAALEAARRQLPDLLLVALQLRDVPGVEAIGWFKADPVLCAIPVIGISVSETSAEETRFNLVTAGVLLRKPFSGASLDRAIQTVLRRSPRAG
jgi:two-component system, cell cycle response regulator DivK